MTTVLGVDLDTKKISMAVVTAEDETHPPIYITASGGKGKLAHDRFVPLIREAAAVLDGMLMPPIDLVAIEGLPFVKNRRGFESLAKVLGAFEFICAQRGLRTMIVKGSDWKKSMGLSGNANKAAIMRHVVALIDDEDFLPPTQDHADALCVGIWGISHGG